MQAEELNRVTKTIDKLAGKKYFEGKTIYVFAATISMRQIIKILIKDGYCPANVIDNDASKHGSFCAGVQVVAVDDVTFDSNSVVLIYSFFWREMVLQLKNLGLKKNQILPLVPKDKPVWENIKSAVHGKRLYDGLIKTYGDVPVFLCPYSGTGDIYLIGTFWDEYVKYNNISDYVFLVTSGACKKVAMIFDIKNLICLPHEHDSVDLISYYNLCPPKVNLKLLNDAWVQLYDNPTMWFRGYKDLHFTKLFRKWVFELPEGSIPRHPEFKDVSSELERIFEENKLVAGKTIVLSPYSNTLSDLPDSFWEGLCRKLLDEGYIVCTNSSGPKEPVVPGSIGVFFPLNIAPQFMSRAGGFIGVRSGFCDIISGSGAKKVILYDEKNRFFNASAFDYFNLKDMELCDDAVEIKFHNDRIAEIEEQILSIFRIAE